MMIILNNYWGGGGTEKYAEYKVALAKLIIGKMQISNCLDFGCGTGRGLDYFRKYFGKAVNIYGCDVSDKELEIAAKILPKENLFNNSDPKSLKEFGVEFDFVMLACVLHHIAPQNRKMWIDSILKSMKKGGIVAVFEHNVINPMTKKIILDPNNMVDDITWMLDHNYLKKLFIDAKEDVKILWDGYTLFSPFRFRGLLHIEKLLKRIPLGAQHCIVVKKL